MTRRDFVRLGTQLLDLDHQTEWADALTDSPEPRLRSASLYHNWDLGVRLARIEQHGRQPVNPQATCKGSSYRFGLALLQAIIDNNADARTIAADLLRVSAEDAACIDTGGILLPRGDIQSVAAGDGLLNAAARQAIEAAYNAARRPGGALGVLQPGAQTRSESVLRKLHALATEDPPDILTTIRDISDHFAGDDSALDGMDHLLNVNAEVPNHAPDIEQADVLGRVWQHCSQAEPAELRDSLLAAFGQRLRDIDADRPCNAGCMQRLLQVPEGIDPRFDTGLPDPAALDDEVSRLVALLDADLQQQIDNDLHARRQAAQRHRRFTSDSSLTAHSSVDRRLLHSSWKTAAAQTQMMFKQQAIRNALELSLVVVRGLPDNLARPAIEKALRNAELADLYQHELQLTDLGADYRDGYEVSLLRRAARTGDEALLRKQLQKGADPNWPEEGQHDNWARDFYGTPVMGEAIANGHTHLVKWLLDHARIDPNLREIRSDGKPPATLIGWAIAKSDSCSLTALLAHTRIDPNLPVLQDWPALGFATRKNDLASVQALLEHPDTDPNQTMPDGVTPLMMAIENGHIDIALALIDDPRTDTELRDYHGRSAVLIAHETGAIDLVLRLLDRQPPDQASTDAARSEKRQRTE